MASKTTETVVVFIEAFFWGGGGGGANAAAVSLCSRCSQTSFWQLEQKDRNSLDGDEEEKPKLALLAPAQERSYYQTTQGHIYWYFHAHILTLHPPPHHHHPQPLCFASINSGLEPSGYTYL